MHLLRTLGFLVLAITPYWTAAQQQPLPRIQINAGIHLIDAEVAASYATRAQGLMYRKLLGANEGMLFVFPQDEPLCMWMRNTYVPLSVAFMDRNGVILNIEDMQPQTDDTHCAVAPARYALEMNQGWFAKRGVKAGMKIGGIEKAPKAQ
jgi:uncharacterized membrane protein (UPF0127 family)